MNSREINTKEILKKWQMELEGRLDRLKRNGHEPRLNIITVSSNEDGKLYVNNKIKKAEELGIECSIFRLDEYTNQDMLNKLIGCMRNPTILQLPIPKHLDKDEALRYLKPEFDVDGLTIYQKGLLVNGDKKAMIPATAAGVVRIIEHVTNIQRKKVAILSRSELIGKPLAQLILQKDGYPIVMHSKIPEYELNYEMMDADIVVTGCGKRAIFDSNNFDVDCQILIDCSMYRSPVRDGVGDIDKEDILKHTDNLIASGYGHTGPATVMGLMENVVKYYELADGI